MFVTDNTDHEILFNQRLNKTLDKILIKITKPQHAQFIRTSQLLDYLHPINFTVSSQQYETVN